MKRILTIMLAVVILCSLTITAYAETEGSLKITTTVVSNPPTWNLSIPADIDIPYQQEKTEIGTVQITDLNNPDKHSGWVDVFLTYENLKNGENEIVLSISGDFEDNVGNNRWKSGEKFPFAGYNGKPVYEHAASFDYYENKSIPIILSAYISFYSWEHSKPGTYSTTLTFTTQYGGYGVEYGY